jgi:hypothetical protein
MAKSSKPKLLTNKGKSPLLKGFASSASKKSPLMPGQSQKKNYSKAKLPEQAFAIPGFGMTGLTGES